MRTVELSRHLIILALSVGTACAVAADEKKDENLEFPPMVPDEVITGEVTVEPPGAEQPVAPVATTATAPVATQPAPAVASGYTPAPVYSQGETYAPALTYGYPDDYGSAAQGGYYPGYDGGYGYGATPSYGIAPGYGYTQPGYGYAPPSYGYGRPGYGYPPSQPRGYYGYPRKRSSNGPVDFGWPKFDFPSIGGTWTEGPWNNNQFKKGDWIGHPSKWFQANPKEGAAWMWEDMVNAPAEMGTMPGGWEFPTVSTPNPVDVGEELGTAPPQFVQELPNMIEINP